MVKKSAKRHTGEEWYTPSWLFDLLCEANGDIFDLDPCAPPEDMARPKARRRIEGGEAGLTQVWGGNVVVNPQHGGGGVDRWVDKAMRAVHWDKTAGTVVALLPARPTEEWWVTYVRGWATVLLVRGRLRLGNGNANRPPFASAVVIWGDEARFTEYFQRQPKSVVDGVWLPAYRAASNSAPFLRSLTTQAKMKKLYGSYDDFRKNLAAWTARMPPEYADVVGQAQAAGDGTGEAAPPSTWHVNRYGYVTSVKGKAIYWKTLL